MVCNVTLMFFCLSTAFGPSDIDIHIHQTVSTYTTISGGGWQARYAVFDFGGRADPATLTRACADNHCVYYSRHCGDKSGKSFCEFVFDDGQKAQGISFTARDTAKMQMVLGNFSYMLKQLEGPGVPIPFTLFTRATP